MGISTMAKRSVGLLALGAAALSVAGVGIARATTDQGGVVLGGVANHTTKPTGFINKKGPALALKSNKHKAPFTVNSSKLVKHLNAAAVGGRTAGSLETAGSSALLSPPISYAVDVSLTDPMLLASTDTLSAGTYFVNVSVAGFTASTATLGCTVSKTAISSFDSVPREGIGAGSFDFPITRPMKVSAGQKVQLWCQGSGTGPVEVGYLAMTATKIDKASAGSTATATPHAG